MKIGLFFGSFNPVHHGHLIIANYICQTTDLDKVWFVVSPHNPLKNKESLLGEYDRLHLLNLAIEGNENLQTCNIEFNLPKPSYTIDTLTYLTEKYLKHQFVLIMGSDNLATLHKWKNYELLLQNFDILVYKRTGFSENPYPENTKVKVLDFPYLDISSTFIRNQIKKGLSVQYLVPDKVSAYLSTTDWYK